MKAYKVNGGLKWVEDWQEYGGTAPDWQGTPTAEEIKYGVDIVDGVIILSNVAGSDILTDKIATLYSLCKTEITGGFISNALGADYWYNSATWEDQINLIGAKSKNDATKYTCYAVDGQGVPLPDTKARRNHTAAQMQTVYETGAAIKEAALDRLYLLEAEVKAIADTAALSTWSPEARWVAEGGKL